MHAIACTQAVMSLQMHDHSTLVLNAMKELSLIIALSLQ